MERTHEEALAFLECTRLAALRERQGEHVPDCQLRSPHTVTSNRPRVLDEQHPETAYITGRAKRLHPGVSVVQTTRAREKWGLP